MLVSRRTGPDDPRERQNVNAVLNMVDGEFFATAGIDSQRGRNFTERDFEHALSGAIISASLAQELFGASGVLPA
jgi:hypothetical protein